MVRRLSKGTRLFIRYECKGEDGTLLETSGEEPVLVTLGEQDVLPALERQLSGMQVGEVRTVILKPNDAFGYVQEDLFFEVPLEMLQLDCEPELGMTVEMAPDGEEIRPGTIVEIGEDFVLVDCNHPMAGATLVFQLTLVAIEK